MAILPILVDLTLLIAWIGGLVVGPRTLSRLSDLPLLPPAELRRERVKNWLVGFVCVLAACFPAVVILIGQAPDEWMLLALWCFPLWTVVGWMFLKLPRRLTPGLLAGAVLPPVLTWGGIAGAAMLDMQFHPDPFMGFINVAAPLLCGGPAGIAAFVAGLVVVPRARKRAGNSTVCAACGYPLTGLPSRVCPECGPGASVL